ncbi:hypothetical protein C8R46DRAFT_1044818 [Mycena filopes]|nr:hypothetical protein C8R46DRAFT_1044818 [Mycena filopes]
MPVPDRLEFDNDLKPLVNRLRPAQFKRRLIVIRSFSLARRGRYSTSSAGTWKSAAHPGITPHLSFSEPGSPIPRWVFNTVRTCRSVEFMVIAFSIECRTSDVLALAWPESHGFGPALPGFGLENSEARPKAKAKPTPGFGLKARKPGLLAGKRGDFWLWLAQIPGQAKSPPRPRFWLWLGFGTKAKKPGLFGLRPKPGHHYAGQNTRALDSDQGLQPSEICVLKTAVLVLHPVLYMLFIANGRYSTFQGLP